MQGHLSTITITTILRKALRDWCTIIKQVLRIHTHILQLVDGFLDFLGYCDLCYIEVGGVLMGITKNISYIVWRLPWPKEIQDNLVMYSNPNSRITMNDLELAGIILEWLV